ncbi:hypothetical protein CN275_11485 [Bacillus anthracis]|nr:hypothetical protein CN275_11485 [Bacillus anthracis]PFR02861.1 hypothetical protein COK10_27350 [Bacillus anthracis]PGZ29975.1 hypothetical protein COE50_21480 [Bacillus anthracis]
MKSLSCFVSVQLQRLEQSVVSRLPTRQKAPLRQEFQRPLVLSELLPLLITGNEGIDRSPDCVFL